MKILQIATSLRDWGGIERYVAYLSQGLESRGHEVNVAVPAGSPLAEKLAQRVHNIELKGQFDLRGWGPFIELARKERYDVVHAHFSPDFVIPVRAIRIASRSKIVMTRHLVQRWNPFKSWTYRSTFDHFIAVSDAVRDSMISDSRIPADRVTTAKAGCDPLEANVERSESRRALGIPSEAFAAGFFGRLTIEKGADDFIRAAAMANQTSAHIFGDGPAMAELTAMPEAKSVHFHGYIPNVADAMNAMDAIVIPSWWAEAFPYAVLEAMSLGKPIIACRVGGLPEMIEDGVTGILVAPKSPQDIAAALEGLMQNLDLREAMGCQARDRHQNHYLIEHFADRIEAVYRKVLMGGNSLE